MADRPFVAGLRTLDTELVDLFSVVTFGATSAVSSQDSNGLTVTALGAGTFTVTCADKYNALLGVVLTPLNSAATDTGWQVITDLTSGTTITIRNAPGGVATHPQNPSSLFIRLTLRNTAAPRKGA